MKIHRVYSYRAQSSERFLFQPSRFDLILLKAFVRGRLMKAETYHISNVVNAEQGKKVSWLKLMKPQACHRTRPVSKFCTFIRSKSRFEPLRTSRLYPWLLCGDKYLRESTVFPFLSLAWLNGEANIPVIIDELRHFILSHVSIGPVVHSFMGRSIVSCMSTRRKFQPCFLRRE